MKTMNVDFLVKVRACDKWVKRFVERYGDRDVPLLEVLIDLREYAFTAPGELCNALDFLDCRIMFCGNLRASHQSDKYWEHAGLVWNLPHDLVCIDCTMWWASFCNCIEKEHKIKIPMWVKYIPVKDYI